MTIWHKLVEQAQNQPDAPFIALEGEDISYGQFSDEVRRAATYLKQTFSLSRGDRVVLCFGNELEYLLAYFASWCLGLTVIPVDLDCRPRVLVQIVADAQPKLILHSARKQLVEDSAVSTAVFPSNKVYRDISWDEDASTQEGDNQNHPALIMYTSGTTGAPKGVMLSHSSILFTAERIIEWSGMNRDDRELTVLRLTHSFGLGHIHSYVLLGAQIILHESAQHISHMLQRIKNMRATGMPATPALIKVLLSMYKQEFIETCRHLSYIIINTAPIEEEVVQELLEVLPHTRIYMYYGLTEASRTTYISYRDFPDKLSSAGQAPEGVAVRLDATTSEIQVNGRNLMMGYLNHADSFLSDGWFATGDIGWMDEDGFLYVSGRLKEQINVDGLKVAPAEVEKVLLMHPLIQACIVFAVPDNMTHEKVVSAVVLKEGVIWTAKLEVEMKKHCKQQLEIYKIPKTIQAWDAIPLTDSGKPKRLEARSRWRGE
ncbi:class I adenylate-forming enzyme family protein [Marinicrinis sediminis]|uniref:Class I adenylate-forming enzyme family protein n=1 Tax=Marinicrinis sediminis TaxID=1652465 RepID=A0ABW5RAK5_9BACL